MGLDDDLRGIFAKNLNFLLEKNDKTQIDVAERLGIKQSTFSSWCTGSKMPRMDKVQALADYFGVMKSDLIEEKPATEAMNEQGEEDAALIRLYRAASPEIQAAALGMLEAAERARVARDSSSKDK